MSLMQFATGNQTWSMTGRVHDLSIPLQFDGQQPNHFAAQRAHATPMQHDDFVGDTNQGGSCNASDVFLNPHCNGTHTESMGHLTTDHHAIRSVCPALPVLAGLITVTPQSLQKNSDPIYCDTDQSDKIINVESLTRALNDLPGNSLQALVVRTIPNDTEKKSRVYSGAADTPYFTCAAMSYLADQGIAHLLTDTPSVDRYQDQGRLDAHREFFGLPEFAAKRKVETKDATRAFATITEMIFVPDRIADGVYMLNLQIPSFDLDAAPSRPLLYELEAL